MFCKAKHWMLRERPRLNGDEGSSRRGKNNEQYEGNPCPSSATVFWTVQRNAMAFLEESLLLRQKRSNFCLPKVTSFFIQAAGLVYHHDAVVYIIATGAYHQPKAVLTAA